MATGSYNFFNIHTIVILFALLDDDSLGSSYRIHYSQ